MSQPQAMPRAAAAPPTPQEIERKLGSPTLPPPPGASLSSSLESVDLQRRFSNASRRAPSMSSGDEGDEASPPLRANAQLSAISEAEDAFASGSESDASSLNEGGRRPSRPDPRDLHLDPSRTSRDSGGLSENVALKSGYLMKKGEKRKTWKKRWFVLRGQQLTMYKTDKEYRLLRLIPIPEIHSVSPVELKKHPHAFGIVTPQRTYYVEASSIAEVHSWCELINRAKADYGARATVTSVETPSSGPGTEQPTPMGPSPAQTPRQEAYRPDLSMAIPIPAAGAQGGQPQQPPPGGSYATTTSFGPSSYTSSSSSYAPPVPSIPPNSLANASSSSVGGGLGLNHPELELQSLDAGISKVSLGSAPGSTSGERGVPQRSSSGVSDTLNLPPSLGGVGAQPSPGLISSSEDEDGFEAYEQQFGSPGSFSALGPQQPAQQQQFEQQQQQQQQYYASPPSDAPAPIASNSPPPDPNKVILAGYLMKQGKRKNWRKRWFVLHSGVLMYSRSHMDTKFHRQIPLTSIIDAIEYDPATSGTSKRTNPLSPSSPSSNPSLAGGGDSSRSYEHCFKIITPKRTYLCCAPSEEDEIKWLAALQCLVARRTQAAAMGASASGGPLAPTSPPSTSALASPGLASGPTRSLSISTPGDATPKRAPSQTTPSSSAAATGSRPLHGRQRSVTDAARQAVKDVERRYRPQIQQPPAGLRGTAGEGTAAA